MIKEDKGFYDKKFVYLDYLERGKKVKNGGFYKWEVKGDTCRVMIHIRGLYPTDTMQGELLIVSQGINYPADQIALHLGSGEYLAVWNASSLAGTEVGVEKCDGLQIRLSENRLLKGLWKESQEAPVFENVQEKNQQTMILADTDVLENPIIKKEPAGQEIPVVMEEPFAQIEPRKIEELVEQDIPNLKEEPALTDEQKLLNEIKEVPLAEKPLSLSVDKWQQLKNQFITITPFQDGREYLSITPRDFTVLPGKYQTLVQNSFLLHGYYNYGHVVLVREKDRLDEKYYLGVPGVYYDREKQAALMFGFEGFEGGNAKTMDGGFGYYMKRVEI